MTNLSILLALGSLHFGKKYPSLGWGGLANFPSAYFSPRVAISLPRKEKLYTLR